MNTNRYFLGLGAVALVLTTQFLASSCQTTGKHMQNDETMMQVETLSDNQINCGCKEEGKKCACDENTCNGGSCGGEADGSFEDDYLNE